MSLLRVLWFSDEPTELATRAPEHDHPGVLLVDHAIVALALRARKTRPFRLDAIHERLARTRKYTNTVAKFAAKVESRENYAEETRKSMKKITSEPISETRRA